MVDVQVVSLCSSSCIDAQRSTGSQATAIVEVEILRAFSSSGTRRIV
jgi:hypothetical protein